ncbi:Chromate transporter [Tepidanaerobacter acetatoxydans Re1]|uniref:Chromate transporter n=1 Tax=Tepidanaerobacter acetatoxydans (strain DSM 21804 / JCM 16047 / Re1) TaxID=1209989 RepID=F4LWH3_TEPAE|nr:chromate transporter [Tepidanaerobacter acetatoxydans]AEE91771.1 Chromate transporter [Tepidanaerobacter acetatoxydans Re1]CCP26547.1 Chromate transporter [Tepidanaerobacter acetatoxydans Re1]
MKNKNRIKLLIELFATFFKIGSFTFGGGYAMIPLIEREVVENKKWVTSDEVIDVFAVAQSMPGAIAINSSTFIGYKIAGKRGAIIATAGVILPSLLIITVIAMFFSKVQDSPIVKAVFSGIRPAIVALILTAAIKVSKTSIVDKIGLVLSVLAVILVVVFDVQAIVVILGGAAVGLGIYYLFPLKAARILNSGGHKD